MLFTSRKLLAICIACIFFSSAHASKLSDSELNTLIEKSNSGDMSAQIELADRYYAGDGVNKDFKLALPLYTALANESVAQAQMALALMYIRGEGTPANNEQAIHWLVQAAEQRVAPAHYYLGLAYTKGYGVDKDDVTAYMWYEIAAAVEHKNAIEAAKELAQTMSRNDILLAEQKATEWWMKHHH